MLAEKHGVCGNPVRLAPRTPPCSSAPGGIVILAMEATTNQEATVSGFTPTAEQEIARWLRREGKRYGRFVHVLVLEAFVGPRPPGGEARHLNGDQRDNRVVNLAWGTHAENTLDREIHGRTRRGSDVATARLDSEAVAEIRAAFARGESMRSLARRFPVGRRQIGRIVRGESWS